MKTIELSVERRSETGKGAARRSRAKGKIPAVVYGAGKPTVAVHLERRALTDAFRAGANENAIFLLKLADSDQSRHAMIRELSAAGIPTGVMAAPMIPALNDHELEGILEAAAENGAGNAGYVLLRLPHEVAPLFVEWLHEHYPDRAGHVLSLLRQLRGGELYDSRWGSRQRGFGPFAALLKARFQKARKRYGLERDVLLRSDKFVAPRSNKRQIELGF